MADGYGDWPPKTLTKALTIPKVNFLSTFKFFEGVQPMSPFEDDDQLRRCSKLRCVGMLSTFGIKTLGTKTGWINGREALRARTRVLLE